jgi:hypothetical protein
LGLNVTPNTAMDFPRKLPLPPNAFATLRAMMQVEAVLQMLQPRPQSFPLGGPTQYTKTVLKPASRLTGPCQ